MKIRALLIAAAAALATAAAPALAGAATLPTQERLPLSIGHVDAVAPSWADGRLTIGLHDDSGENGSVERDPGEVLLHAKPESEVEIPAGIDPAFYAVWGPAGSKVWLLPQTQNPDLLWAGWSSETIPDGTFSGNAITWRLLSVSGPGWLKIFDDSPFGLPQMKLDGSGPLPVSTEMRTATHAHFNWLFSAKGLYRIRFEVSATPAGADGPVSSGPVEYRAFVGDLVDLPDDPIAPELSIAGLHGSYAPGEQVELSAVQSPQGELDHYHWFARCGSATDFAEVGGGAAYAFTAAVEQDGCDYRVTLYDATHTPVATSPTVTLHVAAPAEQPPVEQPPAVVPPIEQPPVVTPPAVDPPAIRRPTGVTAKLSLTARAATTRGRRLAVGVRLGATARVTVEVRRGDRVLTRPATATVRAGTRSLRIRLRKPLTRGRYRVVVTARADGRVVTRTLTLRVR
ncbi:choice-of-anchor M domain-containing protein [Conexibacter sp. JD483]|uniref:choice-of-anchor M domain-containing protein n=1 Tax=unclassified Conexibacter TaxID=2627773 RepID=UPI002725AE87|nr:MULTISPECIES: choice-of-anchor M domain-containing protein [unclassified Conexibacter]MDO8183968.1 choice-of-anchor M domain-containing protein [Conexibacter sp. CPCC 205706]MDO8196960.1 choice-of-anchor M domain-containing protein [Conexibacter sp. CPCC 205762]MDR9369070.1 choice-of-anchor M domain-containing protein [Conexibacter sp. JD483]